MDDSGFYPHGQDFDPFTDLLFNALLGFAFMFFIAFVLINPEDLSGKIDTNAEFVVTVTWEDEHPDDIDTYVEDPAGNLVWYHQKEAGLMHLDRDDRGNYRDTILVNGERIINPLNQETISVRGIVPGEYVVNIVHYLATGTDTVSVKVKVEKLNPRVTLVYYGIIDVNRSGQEETAVRFTVADDGSVNDVNTREKSLVQLSRRAQKPPSASGPAETAPPPIQALPQGIILDQ